MKTIIAFLCLQFNMITADAQGYKIEYEKNIPEQSFRPAMTINGQEQTFKVKARKMLVTVVFNDSLGYSFSSVSKKSPYLPTDPGLVVELYGV